MWIGGGSPGRLGGLEKIGIIRSKPPPGSLLPGPLGHMPRFKVPNMKCLPPGPTSWSHQCKNMSDGSHGSPPPYYLLANEHAKFLHKSARELIHHDSGLMKEAGRTFCNHRGLNRGRFVLICTFLFVLISTDFCTVFLQLSWRWTGGRSETLRPWNAYFRPL